MDEKIKLPPVLLRKRPPPETPTSTLYVNGLNDQVNLRKLKRALEVIFENYSLHAVYVKKSLRLKGQAYILLKSVADAVRAKKDINGFVLLGRPLSVHFTHFKSDYEVRREGGDMEQHKAARKAERTSRRKIEREEMKKCQEMLGRSLFQNQETPPQTPLPSPSQSKHLPPHHTLFVQKIPAGVTKAQLEAAFKRYPGFVEVRTVPINKTIAFVEYVSTVAATAAKKGTEGLILVPEGEGDMDAETEKGTLDVNFAKKATV